MTEYFAIRPDGEYSQFVDSTPLADFLNAMPELRSASGAQWDSASDHWFTLSLVVSDSYGNFASHGPLPPRINCVSIASSELHHDKILPILKRIAVHIGWELIDDGPS